MKEFGWGRIQLLENYLGASKTLLYFQKLRLILKVVWIKTPNHWGQNLFPKKRQKTLVFHFFDSKAEDISIKKFKKHIQRLNKTKTDQCTKSL